MKRSTTSASNIDRRRLCPGSARMEAPYADQDSEYSKEGTLLHQYFMTGKRLENDALGQNETLDAADFYAEEFVKKVCSEFSVPEGARYFDEREVALVFHGDDGTPLEVEGELLTGHADLIRTWPEYDVRAILDAKFGYTDVPEAASNYQLATYAVMRQQQSPAIATGVAIIQPRNFGSPVTQAFYTAHGLARAALEIKLIWAATFDEHARLEANEKACHFCRAKAVCEAYRAKFAAVALVQVSALDTMDPEKVAETFEMVRFAEKLKDPLKAKMLELIEAGRLPAYTTKPGNTRREIVDNMQAFSLLSASEFGGVEQLDLVFMAASTLSPPKLKAPLAKATGKPQAAVERALRELLAPVTSEKQNAPSIMRVEE